LNIKGTEVKRSFRKPTPSDMISIWVSRQRGRGRCKA